MRNAWNNWTYENSFRCWRFSERKETVLRCEMRVLFPSCLSLGMAWNTVYFTGRWVAWGQNSTAPSLHSLSIKHFTLQWGRRSWCGGTGASIRGKVVCSRCLLFMIVCVCVRVCACVLCRLEKKLCAIECEIQRVCTFWVITDGVYYSADFVLCFTSKNVLSQVKGGNQQSSTRGFLSVWCRAGLYLLTICARVRCLRILKVSVIMLEPHSVQAASHYAG